MNILRLFVLKASPLSPEIKIPPDARLHVCTSVVYNIFDQIIRLKLPHNVIQFELFKFIIAAYTEQVH